MLFLAENILNAANFKHDEIEDTWMAPVRLRPVVTVECDGCDIMRAMVEVHVVLEAADCAYNNFSINGRYVSLVGLTKALVAAVA
jgi:hypothetical protein